ncbi:MAG: hypothetical protein JWM80_4403 [Cyanobacteria bacterium RYN_339]|nr:hypothetical protein [Cyanobacteria bacterium RYN_339]
MTDRIGSNFRVQPPPPPPVQQPGVSPAEPGWPQPGPAPAAGDRNAAVGQVAALPGGDIPLPPGADDDRAYVTQLYKELLGRTPDEAGIQNHLLGLANGTTREQVRDVFLNCAEYTGRSALLTGKPQGPLATVPEDPDYAEAPIDTSSIDKAVESAARWARQTSPELEEKLSHNPDKIHERQIYYALATKVIGALRAHGIDADRLVRASHNEPGNANRYVSDALVLPDGRAIDFFGNDDGLTPQFHDLDVRSPKTDRNTGITDPSLPLSSSTLG